MCLISGHTRRLSIGKVITATSSDAMRASRKHGLYQGTLKLAIRKREHSYVLTLSVNSRRQGSIARIACLSIVVGSTVEHLVAGPDDYQHK